MVFTKLRMIVKRRLGIDELKGVKGFTTLFEPLIRTKAYDLLSFCTKEDQVAISNGHTRNGKCDYCYLFETTTNVSVSKVMKQLKEKVKAVKPEESKTFFDAWEESVKKHKVFGQEGFSWQTSPKFMKEFMQYCSSKLKKQKEDGLVSFEDCKRILETFMSSMQREGGLLERITAFNWHLQSWKHQEQTLKKMVDEPKPGVLYWGYDFADSTLFHTDLNT